MGKEISNRDKGDFESGQGLQIGAEQISDLQYSKSHEAVNKNLECTASYRKFKILDISSETLFSGKV